MIAASASLNAIVLCILGVLVVVVVQLWFGLDRLHSLSGQISYLAHLLERIAPPTTKPSEDEDSP